MIAITTVTGQRYRDYCHHLTESLDKLGIQHLVVHGAGAKGLKVDFWKYIPADHEGAVLFLDADTRVSPDFVMPDFGGDDILGVDVMDFTGTSVRWSDFHLKCGAEQTAEYNDLIAINSGAIFFRNKEVAIRVGKKWSDIFPHDLPSAMDEMSLRVAMRDEKVRLLPRTYNHTRDPDALIFHNTKKDSYETSSN